uniref:Alcohol dehydrogenase-like N-terminal domain-containing protein n=1 Tax=Tetradesmus obliquus TaxID=3088 RepID=A0A383V8Q9_TETOB
MKSALVTGTVTGIGKALCEELGKQGYNLTLIDIDGAALLEQRTALQAAHGIDVLVCAADVCSNSAMERAVREHVARFGGLDVAVLNAGIGERGDYLDPAIATEALEKTLDVDLRAVVSGARLLAQLMVQRGNGGRIITLASAAGAVSSSAAAIHVLAAGMPQRGQQAQRGKGGRIITLASAAGGAQRTQRLLQQQQQQQQVWRSARSGCSSSSSSRCGAARTAAGAAAAAAVAAATQAAAAAAARASAAGTPERWQQVQRLVRCRGESASRGRFCMQEGRAQLPDNSIFPMTAGPYYAAAKAGVVHFVRSLAPRLAPHGVQLAAVCPQYVDTPLVQKMLQHQPEVAKAMMGPLFGQPLLQPSQVVAVIQQQLAAPLPQRGRRVPFREAYAGAGCVALLLQNGTVVDPFAANPAHGALQQTGARVVTSNSRTSSSSSSSSSKQQPVSALAAASAASMARFSSRKAMQGFAAQPLPKAYSKLQVVRLSVKFAEAVQRVTVPMPLPAQLPAGTVLVRRLFVGINASDVNYTSGRYHGSAAAAKAALPYDAGFESVGIVVAAAPDAAAGLPVGSAVATMESGFSDYALLQAP